MIWFNGNVGWRNDILLETTLVPSHRVSMILIVTELEEGSPKNRRYFNCSRLSINTNISCISLFQILLTFDMELVWHLCRRRLVKHTIVFISWTWDHHIILRMLTITYRIRRINISLIWRVTELSPHTHSIKTSRKWVLVKWWLFHYLPLYGFPIAPIPRSTLLESWSSSCVQCMKNSQIRV